jgi:hypothetical protein
MKLVHIHTYYCNESEVSEASVMKTKHRHVKTSTRKFESETVTNFQQLEMRISSLHPFTSPVIQTTPIPTQGDRHDPPIARQVPVHARSRTADTLIPAARVTHHVMAFSPTALARPRLFADAMLSTTHRLHQSALINRQWYLF